MNACFWPGNYSDTEIARRGRYILKVYQYKNTSAQVRMWSESGVVIQYFNRGTSRESMKKKNATCVVNLPKTQMRMGESLGSVLFHNVSTHETPHSILLTTHKKQWSWRLLTPLLPLSYQVMQLGIRYLTAISLFLLTTVAKALVCSLSLLFSGGFRLIYLRFPLLGCGCK